MNQDVLRRIQLHTDASASVQMCPDVFSHSHASKFVQLHPDVCRIVERKKQRRERVPHPHPSNSCQRRFKLRDGSGWVSTYQNVNGSSGDAVETLSLVGPSPPKSRSLLLVGCKLTFLGMSSARVCPAKGASSSDRFLNMAIFYLW